MGKIYFGTRDYMQWVEAPAVNMGMSKVGWGTTASYLNGGAYVRTSVASHKEYDLAWNPTSRDEIEKITSYADGIYGSGPVYWADPFTMDRNILPAYWAAPFMGVEDGINLVSPTSPKPTLVITGGNTLGYPVRSAAYTVTSATPRPFVWVPIPPGYTLWMGARGVSGTGGAVCYIGTIDNSDSGVETSIPLMPMTTLNRFSASLDSSSTVNGARIYLGGSGTVTLTGIMAQLLPTGATPLPGGFISGQGHSGCQFVSQPLVTGYNAVLDRVGATAKLIETEAWQ